MLLGVWLDVSSVKGQVLLYALGRNQVSLFMFVASLPHLGRGDPILMVFFVAVQAHSCEVLGPGHWLEVFRSGGPKITRTTL